MADTITMKTAPVSGSDLVARARALAPGIRKRAFEVDSNRRLADETIRELIESDVLQLLAPRRFGGPQAGFTTFLDAGIELGAACGSTSWIYGILGCHHWILGHFPIEAQEEMYAGNNHALWPLSFSGKGGTAKKVDGGYLVTGRWGFCSGIDFSDWVGVGVLLEKENPHDLFDRYNVIIPKDQGEVIDTWFVSGMRGTGSRDFVANEVFVPEHRVLGLAKLQTGETPGFVTLGDTYPALRTPFYSVLLSAVLCPVFGITRQVIEDFVEATKSRVGFRGRQPSDRAAVQMKIGEAMARYDAAYYLIRRLYEQFDALAGAGQDAPVELRVRLRRDAAYAAQQCVEIVDDLVSRAGAGAQSQRSYLQLAQRDIHTIRTHVVLDVDEVMEVYGRYMLGKDLASVSY